jgi:uncharacterized protein YjbI with pentapeptide repeats
MDPGWASFVVVGAIVLFAWWWIPKKQADRWRLKIRDPKARADVEDNFRKTLSQLFGGVAVLLGAAFAYYQSQLAAEQAQLSLKASSDLLISQQTSKGFEQLGNDNIIVRLGGIYALEGVMNTSAAYHKPVMEALAAFIRQKALTEATQNPDPATSNVPLNTPTDVQAALTVLGRRAPEHDEGRINLYEAKLVRASLISANLVNANLIGADLRSADLRGAFLNYAYLQSADLRSANLTHAYLQGADLRNAELTRANLSEAILIGANLSGADLRNANLNSAELNDADLSSADLNGADLRNIQCTSNTKFPPGLAVSCR